MDSVEIGWSLVGLLVCLAVVAAAVVRAAGLGDWRAPLTAALRAAVQLAAVSAVIVLVLRSMWWTALFVAMMTLIAAATASRRITTTWAATGWLVLPVAAGSLPPLLLAVASTTVPAEPVAVLPVAGILVGGAMAATTLAGRRATEELVSQSGAYEAALALGLSRRGAVDVVARQAAALALVPGQDQTRTVGLVSLPGAFIGVLLAGASPLEAGAAQLLVLVSLLCGQAIATAVTVELVAAARLPVGGRHLAG